MTNVRFHLIGAGGAGMSVVGELMIARGAAVSGSDRADSATLRRLGDLGADVWVGHAPERVPADATVVVSTAIRKDDPEYQVAAQRGQTIIHRSEGLAWAAAECAFVAIAGTHGKTTTSGMLAAALQAVGTDPSYAVGSRVLGFPSGAHLGTGKVFIAEADESDGSFLNYRPRVAIVTNIEPDHLDYYGSRESFEQAFRAFADRLEPGGTLIACADDPGSRALAEDVADRHRVVTYGLLPAPEGVAAHIPISSIRPAADSSNVVVEWPGEGTQSVQVPVPGRHNVLNAVAAMVAGVELGIESAEMARALAAFRGTGRRFEMRGEVGTIRVMDDYAHHPTEVRALVDQARLAAGKGRVLVLFQPHLYSRTQAFAADFANALSGADIAYVCDIYGAREDPLEGVEATLITSAMASGTYVGDRDEAARELAALARPGDLIVTVGAGSVTDAAPVILDALKTRRPHG